MRTLAALTTVVALFLASSCATTTPKVTEPKFGLVQGELDKEAAVKVTCKVMAIDQKSRIVTLKGPAGNVFEVEAGEEVRNLSQVNAGDDVVVRFFEAVSTKVYKAGEAPIMDKTIEVATRAEPGEKPGMKASQEITITATVVEIGTTPPTVVLKGPQGNLVKIYIRDPRVLDKVKVGNEVVINYRSSVAISVEKAQ
ncbi:MAG: hypothetical protein WC889_09205 [Myxococcota bacterium]|jgi:hypothetical protein